MFACLCSTSGPENSVEESDESKNITDVSKIDMTTLEWAKQLEDLIEVIQEKEQELEEYKKKYNNTTITLEQKDNRIVELEKEVIDLNKKLEEYQTEKTDAQEKIRVTEEKDKKIEQLENEVRKHTYNLQGIVNNELWDKNREIEKLQNKFTEKLKHKELEISELEQQIVCKDAQVTVLKEKITEIGAQLQISNEECKYLHHAVEELQLQLKNNPDKDGEGKYFQLKEEFVRVVQDYEKSEKLRLETVNLCQLLTTRLEELAHFLDSLLKHKSVLGMLGSKQRSAIKQAIDQSLDLSKSLSISIMNEDQSLAQLSSITGVLNTTSTSVNASLFDDENNSLTFNSHLSRQRGDGLHNNVVIEQAEIISILRAQIETMKKEIEVRDTELCKQNINNVVSSDAQEIPLKNDNDLVEVLLDLQNKSTPNFKSDVLSPGKIYHNLVANKSCPILKSQSNDNQSESEAWSEPDRFVSQARIGLDTESLKNKSRLINKSASNDGKTSESTDNDCLTINNNKSSKRGSIESRHTILQENLAVLENKLKEKENEILTLKTAILDLDNKSLELKLNMSEEIAKLRNEKIDMEVLLKETEEKIKNFDEIKLETIKKERDEALLEVEQSKTQLEILKIKTVELEKLMNDKNQEYQNKIEETNENWKLHVQKIEQETEINVKLIQDATNELKKQYESELVQKSEMCKKITEMEEMQVELHNLKELLKLNENKIIDLEKSEYDLNLKLKETEGNYREKIVCLKRELNETTLRASQAALDRTKINNEKLKLEAEIRKLENHESILNNDLEEKEKELINVKNSLQKQIAVSEQQKSCLQLKVSELETTNAELYNRLVKLQTSDNWAQSSTKLVDIVNNMKIYGKHSLGSRSRQKSDMSGYASEDLLTDENDCGVFNKTAPAVFHLYNQNNDIIPPEAIDVRNVANSSPDLGIESDQGRFSSLETNITTTRPLLQTLELTTAMNNLLSDNESNKIENYCNIPAHKVLDKENVELKKYVAQLQTGLDKTMSELSKINKTKKQVEKGICKQIHKTSLVLRQARANLDSGSETEYIRK